MLPFHAMHKSDVIDVVCMYICICINSMDIFLSHTDGADDNIIPQVIIQAMFV